MAGSVNISSADWGAENRMTEMMVHCFKEKMTLPSNINAFKLHLKKDK